MYASHGFLRSDIGDVDVVYHDGVYHLFHLVLPNHDFIAHAVSHDGMTWRRVKNALFVGDPGAWDDDMLWTMHVSPDPEHDGTWRMFYTGLARAEHGRVQRVGLARSQDLYNWTRCESGRFPLEIDGKFYESRVDEGRKWVSFRDPFFFHEPETGQRLMLSSARIKDGPLIRRGCVGLAREVAPDHFEFEPPLHRPGLYDDVEVPNLFKFSGRYFLLGSIREDTKIHYWYADRIEGPYENYFDNVLLPRGNYAARICQKGEETLIFNFFAKKEYVNGAEIIKKLLPPPKTVAAGKNGRLRLKSFSGINDLVESTSPINRVDNWRTLFVNKHAQIENRDDGVRVSCTSGYEAFLLPGTYENFRLRGKIALEGSGKCGLVLRIDDEGNGHYLSLDLYQGLAQMRSWGAGPNPQFEHAFRYEGLQEAAFFGHGDSHVWDIEVVAHGMYLEFSLDGFVVLSLVDERCDGGGVGFYVESATVSVQDLTMEVLSPAVSEDAPLSVNSGTSCFDLPDMQLRRVANL